MKVLELQIGPGRSVVLFPRRGIRYRSGALFLRVAHERGRHELDGSQIGQLDGGLQARHPRRRRVHDDPTQPNVSAGEVTRGHELFEPLGHVFPVALIFGVPDGRIPARQIGR